MNKCDYLPKPFKIKYLIKVLWNPYLWWQKPNMDTWENEKIALHKNRACKVHSQDKNSIDHKFQSLDTNLKTVIEEFNDLIDQ